MSLTLCSNSSAELELLNAQARSSMFCSLARTKTRACLSGMSSKAAIASPVTSMGSGTPAFWHMAYILAALTSRRLCSCMTPTWLFPSSTIVLPLSDEKSPRPLSGDAGRVRLLLVRGAHHVLDGDASVGAGTLDLGEVHPHFLRLLLGCLRGVRLLLGLTAAGLLRLGAALLHDLLGDLFLRLGDGEVED